MVWESAPVERSFGQMQGSVVERVAGGIEMHTIWCFIPAEDYSFMTLTWNRIWTLSGTGQQLCLM